MTRNMTRPTWQWATFFNLALVSLFLMTASLQAGKYPTADEAVRQLLPGAETYERETVLLVEADKTAASDFSAQKDITALVTRYVAKNASGVIGYAYLDKHMVRTLPETLIVALDADGKLRGIKVLAFREPEEYIAHEGWMEQFKGKTVQDEIRMKRNIDGITGATLTARAVTQCARRTMAIHEVLIQKDK